MQFLVVVHTMASVGVFNPLPTLGSSLTLYQPMTHICVMSSHKPIIIYIVGLILGVNTYYFVQAFLLL